MYSRNGSLFLHGMPVNPMFRSYVSHIPDITRPKKTVDWVAVEGAFGGLRISGERGCVHTFVIGENKTENWRWAIDSLGECTWVSAAQLEKVISISNNHLLSESADK